MAPSRTHVVTETYIPGGGKKAIVTESSTYAEGDTPLTEQVAGITAGMVNRGNSMAHAVYLSEVGKMPVFRKDIW